MKRILLFILAAAVAAATVTARPASETDPVPEAVVFDIADTHSAYDAYPAFLAGIEEIAGDYPDSEIVVIVNGDLFEYGIAAALRSEGVVDWAFLERLAEMGTVVFNVGNHEFDLMAPAGFAARAGEMGVEVIGTVAAGDALSGLPAYADIPVGDKTLRIVGVGTDQINTYPKDLRESLSIPEPIAWMSENYASLASGADAVILSTHAGLVADRGIASSFTGNTLYALGGHDHLTLETRLNGVPYIHAGFKGETIHWTEIAGIGTDSPDVSFRALPVSEVNGSDADLAALAAETRERWLAAEDLEVLGRIPADMSILESVDWAVNAVRDAVGADAAFLNHTSFGSGMKEGDLRRYEFDTFMRFDNDVMVATVDAQTLETILSLANQHRMADVSKRTGDFLYGSELEEPLSGTYRIATSSWVALDFNQMRYLGSEIEFEKVPGVTTKGILIEDLKD